MAHETRLGFYPLRVLPQIEERPAHRSARDAPLFRLTYLLLGQRREASLRAFNEADARRIFEGRWDPRAALVQAVPLPEGAPTVGATGRLPAALFDQVAAEHIWRAVQYLRESTSILPFGPSDDFDVLLEDGQRLPPKAVFGFAASEALGFKVLPEHFTGGLDTPCFRRIEAAGFPIVRKNEAIATVNSYDGEPPREWIEGGRMLATHMRRERGFGLAEAKKENFLAQHGRLYCELCKMEPSEHYETAAASACIEVHHRATTVQAMEPGTRTRLEDVQCLCANCHRVVHRRLRLAALTMQANSKLDEAS